MVLLEINHKYVCNFIRHLICYKKQSIMKKILIAIMLVTLSSVITAQTTVLNPNPFPKTITVSGSAEMEIVPDEIFVNVTLREYQKRGEDKKDIETIKVNFLESCKAAGIPDSLISIYSYTGFNNYYFFKKRKKDPDMQSSITYQVKFKDSKTMDALVEKLDDEATQNFIIVNTSHSKITEFRKQLKIKAVQAAKEKGIYLTDAVGEKLGEAITIKEPNENLVNGLQGKIPGVYSNSTLSSGLVKASVFEDRVQEIDFRKLKLRFEVDVVFALK